MRKCLLFYLIGFVTISYGLTLQEIISERDQRLLQIQHIHPVSVLPEFTQSPPETSIQPNELNRAGIEVIERQSEANRIYQQAQNSHAISANEDLQEIKAGAQLIDDAENAPAHVGCADHQCDHSGNQVSSDMNEGLAHLGAIGGNAEEVASKQIGSNNPAIFTGFNYQCRIAIAGIGNCCGGHARFLNCSAEEKGLGLAIYEGRAVKVGRYCANRKVGVCLEEKESWCVFSSKLSGVIQHQGRLNQLGISFGWARGKHNAANCRGITPEELSQINFQRLDLSAVLNEFQSHMALPDAAQQKNMNQAHIEWLSHMGKAHD